MLHDRSLTQNSLQQHHSWVNENGGHSYDNRHDSSNDFEGNMSDGYGVGSVSDVAEISTSPATYFESAYE